jgi:3-hydroxyacyl-[acyl-carrier-protein] dehydratase
MNTTHPETEVPAEAKTTLDINEIQRILPHRYPFLLIDRVIDLTRRERIVAIKNVTINEPFFQGHFPGHPVMPGVLIIEAMAQTAAVLVVDAIGDEARGKLVYFTSIDDARFRRPVVPGSTLHVPVERKASRGPVWKFHARAMVDDKLMAEATFGAMIMDNTINTDV